MGRLKLLLADYDQAYVECLTGYLMEKFPYKFQVNYFTNIEKFQQFFMLNGNKINIILASDKFINEIEYIKDIKENPVVIKIVEREISKKENAVYKYCHGDNLVQDIIDIYEKSSQASVYIQKKLQTTRVLTIYSPSGGAGKTTIAINASRYFAREGFRVFYMNLESINSSYCFFEEIGEIASNNQSSFSKILFALKEKDEALNVKIKEITKFDPVHNIGYFLPPESSLELDEMSSADIKHLLDAIKLSGLYDIILIDLPSSFNFKTIAMMEESHEIAVITAPDRIAINKLDSFLEEIQLYENHENKRSINFLGRMILIMNRWEENSLNNQNFDLLNHNLSKIGKSIEIKLPYEKINNLQNFAVNDDSNFGIELQKLVHKYCK